MLQKCCKIQSREPAASGTWHRGSGCSPVLMLNLGAENPHGASAYVPEDPHTDGMVRPPKPARKEHEAPGGALTGGSREFYFEQQRFSRPKDRASLHCKAKCSLTQTQQLTPTWKEQRSHYNSIFRGGGHLSCLSSACLTNPKIIFFLGKDLVCSCTPSHRPGIQKEHRKRGFPRLMVIAFAPGARER